MAGEASKTEWELQVSGMSCEHCVASVTKAVEAVPGVDKATVDLSTGVVVVTGEVGALERRQLVEAIQAAGYEAS